MNGQDRRGAGLVWFSLAFSAFAFGFNLAVYLCK